MNDLLRTVMALSGDENVVVIRKPLVNFTGCLEAGIMLNQLLYWTPRSKMDGWIAKTDKEWMDELCLSQYGVRKAREVMEGMGILETKVKKFNNTPTVHYRLDLDAFAYHWELWLNRQALPDLDFAKSQDRLCENAKSITETTTEKEEVVADAPPSQPPAKQTASPKIDKRELRSNLATFFQEKTGIPYPEGKGKYPALNKLWWTPLLNIARLHEYCEEKTKFIIQWAIQEMDAQGLTIKSPLSIEANATNEILRARRSNGQPRTNRKSVGRSQKVDPGWIPGANPSGLGQWSEADLAYFASLD